MKKSASLFFLFLFLLTGSLFSQKKEDLIKQGDDFFEQYNEKAALDKYIQADKLSPKDWQIYWRLSRTYTNIAAHMPESSKDAQLEMYQTALKYADDAVKLAPNESVTYIRRAVVNGRIALFKGVFSVGGIVNSVKKDCDMAIKLNNGGNYVQGLSHYILARTNAKVSEKWAPARAVLGLGWADNEVAIQEYKKAISLVPNFRMFYLDYARSLVREDMYKEAKDALNKVFSSPKQEIDDDIKTAEAKKLMSEIKDK